MEEDRIGTDLTLALKQEHSFPPSPICLSECFTRARCIARGNIHLSMRRRNVLLLVVLPSLLPPARQLKQHIVPAGLDFHCFNTMSFFKRGLSEAFRLNAEQTPVAKFPRPSLTQTILSSNLSRHGPACMCVGVF